MFCLYPDVYLTRRQRLHYVMDADDVLMWSGKSLVGAFEYLLESGNYKFRIEGQDQTEHFQATICKA